MPELFRPLIPVAETSAEVTALVTRPPERIPLGACLPTLIWHDLGVRVTARPGSILEAPSFLTALRGALGHTLLDGASIAFRSGRPCTFAPACAADILFGTRKIPGGPEVTSPFVPLLDPIEGGAAITLRLFGLATGWSPVIADALVRCIDRGIYLPDGATDPLVLDDLQIVQGGFGEAAPPEGIRRATITTVTPVAFSEQAVIDLWPTLALSVLTRLRAVMRWHGVLLTADWGNLAALLHEHAVVLRSDGSQGWTRRSSRRDRSHRVAGDLFDLSLAGALAPFIPLLLAASVTGVGRRTTFGLGRVAVQLG